MASLKADTIFVSGLDSSIGEEELRNEIFHECGTILSVSIAHDRTGKSLGQANIRFQNSAQAQKAQVDFDGAKVDGKSMTVLLIGTPVQPKVIVKATKAAPVAKAVVKKAPAPKQPQQQQRQPQQHSVAPVRGASRPLAKKAPLPPARALRQAVSRQAIPQRQPRAQSVRPPTKSSLVAQKANKAISAVAGAKKAPVAGKKAAPVAGKKAPVAGKKTAPIAKKAAPKKVAPKKPVSLADLDAQMDKYNAAREAKASAQ